MGNTQGLGGFPPRGDGGKDGDKMKSDREKSKRLEIQKQTVVTIGRRLRKSKGSLGAAKLPSSECFKK